MRVVCTIVDFYYSVAGTISLSLQDPDGRHYGWYGSPRQFARALGIRKLGMPYEWKYIGKKVVIAIEGESGQTTLELDRYVPEVDGEEP